MSGDAVERVSLAEKLALVDRYWAPKIVGELNGQYVKLAKFSGEFVWHKHDSEDEMFLVVKGELTLKLEGRDIRLREGDFAIVPRGVLHLPVATGEAHVLLFEPKSTVNTGELDNELTTASEWI
ncbi:mannose-6-phosphate isomerase [Sorangium cellulosum]|uniref:Mannose-6-phosphate isomerase n=1 Tax=Sorangium cellulosum TaxID=56 RepID=A0A4P2PWM5_SORCE|nr:cupin domain-containing protein [Sorangium cellulosum]AUX21194.1 mannose-6-phosphate isomerase [Sorangium cellulosum]